MLKIQKMSNLCLSLYNQTDVTEWNKFCHISALMHSFCQINQKVVGKTPRSDLNKKVYQLAYHNIRCKRVIDTQMIR